MKTDFTNILKSYISKISGKDAESNIKIGLIRLAYVDWAKNNNFFKSEWEYLDPNLAKFPEMQKAFYELADMNPLLCAFLLLGRESECLFRQREAEDEYWRIVRGKKTD